MQLSHRSTIVVSVALLRMPECFRRVAAIADLWPGHATLHHPQSFGTEKLIQSAALPLPKGIWTHMGYGVAPQSTGPSWERGEGGQWRKLLSERRGAKAGRVAEVCMFSAEGLWYAVPIHKWSVFEYNVPSLCATGPCVNNGSAQQRVAVVVLRKSALTDRPPASQSQPLAVRRRFCPQPFPLNAIRGAGDPAAPA